MTEQLEPMPTDWTRALAVVAHPDDIEIGASGAVAAWTKAGRTVSYLILSSGEAGIDSMPPEEVAPLRRAEQRAGAGVVGVAEVTFLEHPDGVIEAGPVLRRDIAHALRRHRPELVLGFNHRPEAFGGKRNSADHRNVGTALIDAVADAGNRWVFPQPGLEPWGGVKYVALAASPAPTHAVDITDTMDLMVTAIEQHRTYLDSIGITDVRAPVSRAASWVAERFGGTPAQAFELVPF